jgi:hypothetical protein
MKKRRKPVTAIVTLCVKVCRKIRVRIRRKGR